MKVFSSVYHKTNSPNFASRTAQIRDAQWVCRAINTTFPHISPTKFKPLFEHYIKKTDPKNANLILKDIEDIYSFVKQHSTIEKNGFLEKIKQFFRITKNNVKKDNTFEVIAKNIEVVAQGRQNNKNTTELERTVNLLSIKKMGNCQENAVMAELVMKLNGFKNASSCLFYEPTDSINKIKSYHAACIFNLDDSRVEQLINNKTIIIDPWLGKADFANNMLKYYANECKDILPMPEKEKVKILPIHLVYLTHSGLEEYKNKFPRLVFKAKDHKFMQKK